MTAGGRAREGNASGGMDARPRGRRRHDVRTWEGDTDRGTPTEGRRRGGRRGGARDVRAEGAGALHACKETDAGGGRRRRDVGDRDATAARVRAGPSGEVRTGGPCARERTDAGGRTLARELSSSRKSTQGWRQAREAPTKANSRGGRRCEGLGLSCPKT